MVQALRRVVVTEKQVVATPLEFKPAHPGDELRSGGIRSRPLFHLFGEFEHVDEYRPHGFKAPAGGESRRGGGEETSIFDLPSVQGDANP